MLKGPRYSGMSNPLRGGQAQSVHGVPTQAPIGVKQGHPIGRFQIGQRTQSSKVKEIFG